jgi:mono/diheme cytochrome c family protein
MRPSLFAYAAALTLVFTTTACSRTDAKVATFATYDAGAVPGGPGASKRFALGQAPNDSALAAMNVDVGADGIELPAGHGTVAEGAALFATQCAQCHGKAGEGMPPTYPALIGRDSAGENFRFALNPKLTRTIGNYWPYATTVFDYVKRAMPLLTPRTLTDDQIYALTAYLLAANAIIPDTTTLDATRLRAVRMPYRDRFVPDDRQPNSGKP